jgi:uncharacterized protein
MLLKDRLRADLNAAMRDGRKLERDTLRELLAAIKQEEVDRQVELDDAGVQRVLTKQARLRRESIADFELAGRPESVQEETEALAIIESYLPQMMSREEITAMAAQTIAELGVSDARARGQVMGRLMPQLQGKADGRLVNEVVGELLSGK